MNVKTYTTAADFLAHVGKYLAKNEARYGLMMGLAKRLMENPHSYGQDNPWFCSVSTGAEINATAIRTPPYPVDLGYFSGDMPAIAEKLAAAVADKFSAIPSVVGDKELVDLFANLWCEKYDVTIQSAMAQRIYRLVKVNDVPLAPGRFRVATLADKELVLKWSHSFHIDIGGEARNQPETDITPVLEHGWAFIWEDGKPVSMAIKVRPTDKGMTVSGVYTPPELRGKGYATSCVAELSRNILQSGKEFCMLYTDLANPTSNSIYKKIGYQEVCDSMEYIF